MFLWRWFKKLVSLAVFLGVVYVGSGFVKYEGKPARQYADEFFRSELWHEGVKDFRTWAAQALRLASSKIEEGITPADQQQLNKVIEDDLQKQIEGAKTAGESQPVGGKP